MRWPGRLDVYANWYTCTWNALHRHNRGIGRQLLTCRRPSRILALDGTGVESGPLAVEIPDFDNSLACTVPWSSLRTTAIQVAGLLRRGTFDISATVCGYPVPRYMQRWHTARASLPTHPCCPRRIGHVRRLRLRVIVRILVQLKRLLLLKHLFLNMHVHTGWVPP